MTKGAAIVTGSAQGIGKAIVRRLAVAGYKVCVNDIECNAARAHALVLELRQQHGNEAVIAVIANVTQQDQVQSMIDRTVKELDCELTLMVANAGVCQIKDVLDLTPDDIKFVFDVNFLGLFNCYTLAAKQMISQSKRAVNGETDGAPETSPWKYRIIGASSIVAFKPFPLSSHYSTAKWAVRGFTQGFAMEMAKYHIAVNAYAPGVIATDMWDKIDEGLCEVDGKPQGEASREGAERSLMGRLGTPEDVAKVVAGFLAGPDANFVNGQTLIVDGGIMLT
ncbi:uncharacterized protein Z518_10361 [Rhinocladiella mackenziei CBS 650.93]|uniref:Rhinocladiella mackenziei CBS 650.93 unplaced genomic scaffold supercont1.9, whole genome shotgun sequence n=1 Tax=Rhinocladiella mackenziei CBS 650.93 TaxID=1442369 RepID=A0A0D2FDR0_9EURO|nr:uncharacterized protein Z518_10361 [Rhinocladiella mackenziei CBS 650.93]KIX00222.1 hypothetical protein Z518_10361 [Rhinocladiella mackenziei CBS 650.93]